VSAEYKASLAIYSKTRSVSELTQLIGISPTWTVEKGEPVSRGPGAPGRPHNAVFLEATVTSAEIETALADLLRSVAPNANAIRAYAEADPRPNGSRKASAVTIKIAIFSEEPIIAHGFEISPECTALIASLGASFGVELFVGT
jgi:hypothetical protein